MEFTIETDQLDGSCDMHYCGEPSKYVYRVVDIDVSDEDVEVHHDLCEYCGPHNTSHAQDNDNLYYIGERTSMHR
jgi:hypothetical protein